MADSMDFDATGTPRALEDALSLVAGTRYTLGNAGESRRGGPDGRDATRGDCARASDTAIRRRDGIAANRLEAVGMVP